MILVDPRGSRLADFADLHVPIRVGSDIAFLNGLMHALIQENLYDKTFIQTCTVGFDKLKRKVKCGTNNVLSIANLQMLLGNMGMECGGVNPLRGQSNVQGSCDMGALPNVFPGYQAGGQGKV